MALAQISPQKRETIECETKREKDFRWGVSAKRKMTNFGFFFWVYKSRMNLFFIFLLAWDIDFINQNIFWDLIIFFVEFCNSHKTHD